MHKETIKQTDPMTRLARKKNYKLAKKRNHLQKFVIQGRGRLPKQKVYEAFVKSG